MTTNKICYIYGFTKGIRIYFINIAILNGLRLKQLELEALLYHLIALWN